MKTYSVKQIAEMFNTQPETVRRWIRNGKLQAEKSSRKEGHVVSNKALNKFLKESPKYAGMIVGSAVAGIMSPMVTLPIVGGMAIGSVANHFVSEKKEVLEDSFTKEDMQKKFIKEIEQRNLSIQQKMRVIEHLQREIMNEQQQIAEFNYALKKIESGDYEENSL